MTPQGWRRTNLRELTKESNRRNDGRWGFGDLMGVTNTDGLVPMRRRVQGKGVDRCKVVAPGAFAYNPMRINVGSIACNTLCSPVIVSPDYVVFECDDNRLDYRYFDYIRQSGRWQSFVKGTGKGSVRIRIYYSLLSEYPLDVPPVPEQKKIAAILGSVDEAIAATQAVIDQTRKVKQGLLQQLLTRGIGHTRFKKTEIGEIPEGWAAVPLSNVATVAYGLTVNQARRESKQRVAYLTVANLKADGFDVSSVKTIGVLEGDLERYCVRCGDLLLVEGNGNPDLLGKAGMWRDQLPLVLHQNHLIRVRALPELVDSEWLLSFLSVPEGRLQITSKAKTSSGLHTINSSVVSEVVVPVPPLDEQKKILVRVRSLAQSLDAERRHLETLEVIKRGLMQDLLTGRVRVKGVA